MYKAFGGGWQMRLGKEFVPATITEEMDRRTDWGDLLETSESRPASVDPPKDLWRAPDWQDCQIQPVRKGMIPWAEISIWSSDSKGFLYPLPVGLYRPALFQRLPRRRSQIPCPLGCRGNHRALALNLATTFGFDYGMTTVCPTRALGQSSARIDSSLIIANLFFWDSPLVMIHAVSDGNES